MAMNLSINGATGFVFVEAGTYASRAKVAEHACRPAGSLPLAARDAGMQQDSADVRLMPPASGASTLPGNKDSTVDALADGGFDTPTIPASDEGADSVVETRTIPASDQSTCLLEGCSGPVIEKVKGTEHTLDELAVAQHLEMSRVVQERDQAVQARDRVVEEKAQMVEAGGQLLTSFRGLEHLNSQLQRQCGQQQVQNSQQLRRRCKRLQAHNAGLQRQCGQQQGRIDHLTTDVAVLGEVCGVQLGRISSLQAQVGVMGRRCRHLEALLLQREEVDGDQPSDEEGLGHCCGQVEGQGEVQWEEEEVQRRCWQLLVQRDEQLEQLQQQRDQEVGELQQQLQQREQEVGGLQQQLEQLQRQLATATGTATTTSEASDAAPPASTTPADPPTWAKVALSAAVILSLPVVVPTVGAVAFCCTASRAINQARPYLSKGWCW